MKCFKFFLALIFLSQFNVSAQTSYYKLLKTEIDGRTSTNVSGGQFITINSRACYESDSKGYTVNNGVLYLFKFIDGGKCFEGESYYGKGSKFVFSADMKSLTVSTFSGDKYYYGKAAAPAGVTTSSLIAKKEKTYQESINTEQYWNNQENLNPIVPNGYPSQPNGTSASGNNSSSSSNSYHQYEHAEYGYKDCPVCHGDGKCPTCNGKGVVTNGGGLALDPYKCYCNNGRCSNCNGTGKVYGRIN